MIHQLKIATEYFEAVTGGRKTFEIRKNDRGYAVGDFLALNELTRPACSDDKCRETGRCCLVEVTYILADTPYTMPGYVAMSIQPCDISRRSDNPNFARRVYDVPVYGEIREDRKDGRDETE